MDSDMSSDTSDMSSDTSDIDPDTMSGTADLLYFCNGFQSCNAAGTGWGTCSECP
jgi:hypothetical protein